MAIYLPKGPQQAYTFRADVRIQMVPREPRSFVQREAAVFKIPEKAVFEFEVHGPESRGPDWTYEERDEGFIEHLADEFTLQLRRHLGDEAQMQEVIRRNEAETIPGICHSHDFIDANDAMLDAFNVVVGVDYSSAEWDTKIAGAAWQRAKDRKFSRPLYRLTLRQLFAGKDPAAIDSGARKLALPKDTREAMMVWWDQHGAN